MNPMLVSTFEILLKPQLPVGTPPPAANLSRNVVQGYFLTIANLSAFDLVLSLVFTTSLPPGIVFSDIINFLDTSGTNTIGTLTPDPVVVGTANKLRFSPLFLKAGETGLFILQPNILDPIILANRNFEVRGYTEIFLSSLSGGLEEIKLQVTPEQRGTFFTDKFESDNLVDRGLDQIAYCLPVQNGGLLTLSTRS
jgi:hypothetical protein